MLKALKIEGKEDCPRRINIDVTHIHKNIDSFVEVPPKTFISPGAGGSRRGPASARPARGVNILRDQFVVSRPRKHVSEVRAIYLRPE
ncbi:hypothetical protein EVAR_86753_1 [Eumeta japonica]|uniref:Uncharacterized protein n=1 Tax=Eumeta variegata TaxID=151549 RepID=A0A4C1W101_EUMVA|nr:hypothetical protein EVAR_86753_1 [Eumeta japonica]